MKKNKLAVLVAMVAMLAPAAAAAHDPSVTPAVAGADPSVSIRYIRGTPSVNVVHERGGVLVTPAGLDHGKLVFHIAAFNSSDQPANFGVENIVATSEGQPVAVLTKDELVKRAKSRAGWSMAGMALLGGVAVAAASNSGYSSYHATTYTPHGAYHTDVSYHDAGVEAANTAAAAAATGGALYLMNHRLESTIEGLNDEIVQTTTIDPQQSYGGSIVLEKGTKNGIEQGPLLLDVTWNGEHYLVPFTVAK